MSDEYPNHFGLSEREKQLVKLAASGCTDTAIARRLGISESTIGTYWGRVRMKVGHYSRPELVARVLKTEFDRQIKSLRKENAKLINQIEVMTTPKASDELIAELVREIADAALIVSANGNLLIVNQSASAMFGYEEHEVAGEHLQMLIPKDLRDAHRRHCDNYMKNAEKHKMAEHELAHGLRKDGSTFPVAVSLTPIQSKNGTLVLCIIREGLFFQEQVSDSTVSSS